VANDVSLAIDSSQVGLRFWSDHKTIARESRVDSAHAVDSRLTSDCFVGHNARYQLKQYERIQRCYMCSL